MLDACPLTLALGETERVVRASVALARALNVSVRDREENADALLETELHNVDDAAADSDAHSDAAALVVAAALTLGLDDESEERDARALALVEGVRVFTPVTVGDMADEAERTALCDAHADAGAVAVAIDCDAESDVIALVETVLLTETLGVTVLDMSALRVEETDAVIDTDSAGERDTDGTDDVDGDTRAEEVTFDDGVT